MQTTRPIISTVEGSLVPRPTSQLRMDYITATRIVYSRSGDVIHPQLRCGSGYETT